MMLAWEKRACERQDLIEAIKSAIMRHEDVVDRRVLEVGLIFNIVQYLAPHSGEEEIESREVIPRVDLTNFLLAGEFFQQKILPAIQEFTPLVEEQNALLAKILEGLAISYAQQFTFKLGRQEIMNPKAVFDGHKSTDEVEP